LPHPSETDVDLEAAVIRWWFFRRKLPFSAMRAAPAAAGRKRDGSQEKRKPVEATAYPLRCAHWLPPTNKHITLIAKVLDA
jgi:hypothetical protein